MTDKERLDFLDWLMTRTEFQNTRQPVRAVSSDMHFRSGRCTLYVRNMFGNPVLGGMAQVGSVREAIDEVAGVIVRQTKEQA